MYFRAIRVMLGLQFIYTELWAIESRVKNMAYSSCVYQGSMKYTIPYLLLDSAPLRYKFKTTFLYSTIWVQEQNFDPWIFWWLFWLLGTSIYLGTYERVHWKLCQISAGPFQKNSSWALRPIDPSSKRPHMPDYYTISNNKPSIIFYSYMI